MAQEGNDEREPKYTLYMYGTVKGQNLLIKISCHNTMINLSRVQKPDLQVAK